MDAVKSFAAKSTADSANSADTSILQSGLVEMLERVSTATVSTTLSKSMVGFAFTLRYIPAREDLNELSVFRDSDHPQRKAVETCPPGAVLVMDSRADPRAASAGGILVRRLMMRGVSGVVTDGGFRDSAEIATMDIPAFHSRPSAPTNLTLHHAIDMNVPIGCGSAPVFPGDVILGDGDGVIVIPRGIAEEVAQEATSMTMYENFVVHMVAQGHAISGLYPMTDPAFESAFSAWRLAEGRE
jgi:regulator of RNase E activity RraA